MFDVNGNDLADSGDSCRRETPEQGSRARGRWQDEQGQRSAGWNTGQEGVDVSMKKTVTTGTHTQPQTLYRDDALLPHGSLSRVSQAKTEVK